MSKLRSRRFIDAYPTKTIKLEKLQSFLPYSWISTVDSENLEKGSKSCITLDEDSVEYKEIAKEITRYVHQGTNTHIGIRRIDQLENPYIYLMFLIKKNESYRQYISREERCFHGTHEDNVQPILDNNFNWRFFGKTVGYVHGKGVYFSKKMNVSLGYALKHGVQGSKGCVLVAKVLVASSAAGNNSTNLPPDYYDTTGTGDEILVKYSDNEFYPEYVAYIK